MTEIVETTGYPVAASQEQILEWFAEWMRLDVADGQGSPDTLRAYAGDVRQHLTWAAELGLRPATMAYDDLKRYRAWLLKQYAVSTVGRKLVAVRRFYEMAQAAGYIQRNPGARLRSPHDRTERAERIKFLSWDDFCTVLSLPTEMYADKQPARCDRDLAILTCMGVHGMRVIEVHRLDIDDVALSDGDYGVMSVFGKGSKWRDVYLTGETRPVMDAWLRSREKLDAPDDAVFVTLHTGVRKNLKPHHRISKRSIRALVDGYLKAAGAKRPGISCHAMRHSFATHALDHGAELKHISKALGHQSVVTTQVYAQVLDRDKHNPSRVLSGIVKARNQ